MVKSEKLYSPQTYLELVTGKCYIVDSDDDIEFIENIIKDEDLWSYPLSEIEHIVEEEIDVVLVDCMVYNENSHEYEHVLRWFEVPEDFKEEN